MSLFVFLKCVALITMVIDHLGLFFFPDEMFLRAIGRLSFPIWAFCLGYSLSKRSPMIILFSGFFMTAVMSWWESFLIVNILVSLALSRWMILGIMSYRERLSQQDFLIGLILFYSVVFLISPLIIPFVEYGLYPFAFAVLGFLFRQKEQYRYHVLICLFLVFFMTTLEYFSFSLVLSCLVFLEFLILMWYFSKDLFSKLYFSFDLSFLNIFVSHTLFIYCGHVCLFVFLSFLLV